MLPQKAGLVKIYREEVLELIESHPKNLVVEFEY